MSSSPSQPQPSINVTSLPLPQRSSSPDPSASPSGSPSRPSLGGGRTRSSSLLHKNVLHRMRPLPFQYVFALWHTKPASSTPTLLAPSIPDIASFYKIYNNFPWASVPTKAGVHFFRQGIQPLWEDVQNIDGGCWVLKVRKENDRALKTWEEMCLLVCGGELQSALAGERDHVLGISYSPRLYVAQISVWTKQGGNDKSVEVLQETILGRLSEELKPVSPGDYYYKKHSDHEGWREAVRGKREDGGGIGSGKVTEQSECTGS